MFSKKGSIFMLSVLCGVFALCFIFSGTIFPPDFANDHILDDCWRVPLKHPYEISDLNNMGSAYLRKWEQNDIILGSIVAYSWTTNFVFGETIFLSEDKKYFVFCMTNNALKTFVSGAAFTNACVLLDVDYKTILPVETQWKNHWKQIHRTAGRW